jgi:hypothetical protein
MFRRVRLARVVTHVERARVTFVGGEVPLLVLHDVPEAAALPRLVVSETGVVSCAGWQLVTQVTACELKGPDTVSFYIGALAGRHDVERQREWLAAVEAAGGVVIVATDDPAPIRKVADLAHRPGLRGGFISVRPTR